MDYQQKWTSDEARLNPAFRLQQEMIDRDSERRSKDRFTLIALVFGFIFLIIFVALIVTPKG